MKPIEGFSSMRFNWCMSSFGTKHRPRIDLMLVLSLKPTQFQMDDEPAAAERDSIVNGNVLPAAS
jgi:hypothetical protein